MTKSKAERGRLFSRKKEEAALRLLRGEELDLVSRDLGITAATLSAWRDHFVAWGQASLKSRAADGHDTELAQLKAFESLGWGSHDAPLKPEYHNILFPDYPELSREAVSRLWGGGPLVARRSMR